MTKNTNEYGWLSPNGTFYHVPWGEHQCWANNWLKKHNMQKEWLNTGLSSGDFLCNKGWVLLHNPSGKTALITHSKPLTKQQRDFIYQYYIDRGLITEANKLYDI